MYEGNSACQESHDLSNTMRRPLGRGLLVGITRSWWGAFTQTPRPRQYANLRSNPDSMRQLCVWAFVAGILYGIILRIQDHTRENKQACW